MPRSTWPSKLLSGSVSPRSWSSPDRREELVALAVGHSEPAMYHFREFIRRFYPMRLSRSCRTRKLSRYPIVGTRSISSGLKSSVDWWRTFCRRLVSIRCTALRNEALAGGDRMPFEQLKRREFFTLLGGAISLFLCVSAAAPEGYYGVGHDKWHQGFYSKLKRNDGQGPCCNLMDCRPTQSRMVGDHYEVKVDGVWTPVPYDKINNAVAPDGGAHVCAPRQVGPNKDVIYILCHSAFGGATGTRGV